MTKNHTETRIKVNAWVDSGIAPLVVALNEFDQVETVDSCEGYDDQPYVYFRCRNAKETCDFVYWLWGSLGTHLDSSSDYRLSLEWMGTEEPMARIITTRTYLDCLLTGLSAVRASLLVASDTESFAIS